MKLTAEQQAALQDALNASLDGDGLLRREAILLAGYRLGFEAAREAAAKACESADYQAYPWACAAMIRAIQLPGGEK